MTLLRNRNNGDVFNTENAPDDTVADITARPNFVEVSEKDSRLPWRTWAESLDKATVDPALVFPAGMNIADGSQGPVDVPQSGPTGSKSVQGVASIPEVPPKGLPVDPTTDGSLYAGTTSNPDGKQETPAPAGTGGTTAGTEAKSTAKTAGK